MIFEEDFCKFLVINTQQRYISVFSKHECYLVSPWPQLFSKGDGQNSSGNTKRVALPLSRLAI